MRFAKSVALLGLLSMTGILVYGFTAGDFAAEGGQLLSMPWGIVSLVDLSALPSSLRGSSTENGRPCALSSG